MKNEFVPRIVKMISEVNSAIELASVCSTFSLSSVEDIRFDMADISYDTACHYCGSTYHDSKFHPGTCTNCGGPRG